MNTDYTQRVAVKATAKEACEALSRRIPEWWGSTDRSIEQVGDVFTITFGEALWTFKITEFVRGEKLTWDCIDGQPEFNGEWIGHQLEWTINQGEEQSVIQLRQIGLNSDLPCYDICSAAWDRFILSSLKALLETGKGQPGS